VIIGDITYNFKKNSMHIEVASSDTWIVDARASINSVNQELGTKIPKDRCDTIGGFILKLLGRLPETVQSAGKTAAVRHQYPSLPYPILLR